MELSTRDKDPVTGQLLLHGDQDASFSPEMHFGVPSGHGTLGRVKNVPKYLLIPIVHPNGISLGNDKQEGKM